MTAKFVTTRAELQWDKARQEYVRVKREGYYYAGPWALADRGSEDIDTIVEDIQEAFADYKKANDKIIKGKAEGAAVADLKEKLGRIEEDIGKLTKTKGEMERLEAAEKVLQERIETLEAQSAGPGAESKAEKEQSEYTALFFKGLRHRFEEPAINTELRGSETKMFAAAYGLEEKDVTIGTGSAGGFAVPEQIARDIDKLERIFSPVRSAVNVRTVGTSDYRELVSIRGTTAGWVGETGTRTATATSSLRERVPTMGELYAYPQASEWSLDDIFFDVENWITEEVAEEMAVMEAQAVVDGSGTNRPTGILNTTPVTTTDTASPLRSAEVIQYIDSSVSPGPTIDLDDVIDVVYNTNSRYRARGRFAMNSLTVGAVRKLKDTQGQYLWQPSQQAGQPDRLLGYPVDTWEQLPDIAGNAFPLLFGDFRRAYTLVDRVGLRMTRDNVTNPGFVRFYIRRREGGILRNNDAIKALRT